MLENILNKRRIFDGEIHTPRSADLSLRTYPEQGINLRDQTQERRC